MPRGKPARRGPPSKKPQKRIFDVAKPTLKDHPCELTVTPSSEHVPELIKTSFPEFKNPQTFFSSLERLCPDLAGSYDGHNRCWLGVNGSSISNIIRDEDSAFNVTLFIDNTPHPIFMKRIHLLDPLSAMEGDYLMPRDGALPAPSEPWRNALTKINDPMNEAYVDALFAAAASKLVENNISPHWCRMYGTYNARVEKYMYNISDDYESMRKKPWWRRNMRAGVFKLYDPTEDTDTESTPPPAAGTAPMAACGGGNLEAGDFEDVAVANDTSDGESLIETEPDLLESESVQLSVPKLRLSRISGGSTSDSTESSGEEIVYAEFADFPVQITLLERAEGTLDELLDEEVEDAEDRWRAWLYQIIAALTTAQHMYGFVHNDLHTNNIMWIHTDLPYLCYRIHKGKSSYVVRVPTYGKIMKIIDFGRASYTLPEPGGFFISDAFFPGNDAAEQYNCEPFYDPDAGPNIEPNPSFDLCRLAVSLLESLYPETPAELKPKKIMSREGSHVYNATVSGVYNMLWEWLTDDDGKNVLRKPNGDERYPDFDLYKALAAEVHNAVPYKQLERPLFNCYKYNEPVVHDKIYDLYLK